MSNGAWEFDKNYAMSAAARDIRSRPARPAAGLAKALPRGPHSLTREQVAANQRMRLDKAMLEAVGERGYGTTTVSDVVARAGVSRKAFYEHYANKEECFLAAYDAVADTGRSRVIDAFREADGPAGSARLERAIRALFEAARKNPHAMRLATTEIAAAGRPGIERRERVVLEYGELIGDCLRAGGDSGALPETVLRAMTGGLIRVIATYTRRGRRGRRTTPQKLIPDLVLWLSAYHPVPESLLTALADSHSRRSAGGAGSLGGRAPGTLSPPRAARYGGASRRAGTVSRSFVVQRQRERILDAVTNLTALNGYIGLTVEEIAAEASVSLQAFYAHFESKEDAFLVAYELGHARGLSLVERAFAAAPDWRNGIRDGLDTLLGYLASEPSFAHLSLLHTPIATPRAAELSTKGLAAYTQLLAAWLEEVPKRNRPPPIAIDATAGALHELFLHYAAESRTCELPELTIEATYVALAPFVGTREAVRVAIG
jgi:TetR/AcrR family transcriptional regulator